VQHKQAVKKQQVHVAQKSNFVDPHFVQDQFHNNYGYGGHDVLYLAGQNLQTELIVKEAVREAVQGAVKQGVSSGVSEAMILLREELLRDLDPKQPDVFVEPLQQDHPVEIAPVATVARNCQNCHQGKLEDAPQYDGSFTRIQAVKAMQAIKDGSMPKGKTLTEVDKQLLYNEILSNIN
jgi:hypothetical protein